MHRKSSNNELAASHQEHEDGSGFEGIGLSLKAGWYASAVMYGVGGVLVILLHLLTDSISSLIVVFALVAIAASPIWLVLARVVPTAVWGPHVRIAFGIALISSVIFSSGGLVSSMVPVMMLPVLTSAYMHRARIAAPYCMTATGLSAAAVFIAPSPADTASGVVTLVTMGTLSIAAIVSQYQLRTVAELNNGLSETDALTGLANMRRMRGRLSELLASRNPSLDVALFTMDLDDFKLVNDRFSHATGDDLLKAVANDVQQELEAGDLLARRGGDEFAVIALAPTGRDLDEMRVRIADAIHEARERVCPSINPHGSVGFVICLDGETVDEILARGDDELHEAKLDAHPERRNDGSVLGQVIQMHRHQNRSINTVHEVDTESVEIGAAADLRVARWVQRLLGTGMAWRFMGLMQIVIAGTLELLAVTGISPDLGQTTVQLLLIGPFVLAAISFWGSRKAWPLPLLQVAVLGTIVVEAATIMQAHESRADVVDLCLLPVMFAFYFFPKKLALPFLVLGMGMQTGLLFSSDYPNSTARATATIFVVVVISALLSKARALTREFTAKAVKMSVVDPLTGAANVRGLRRRVVDEIGRRKLIGGSIGMLTIDLDDFKSVNDEYSHTVGDAVLVATVDAIKQVIRGDDMVARRGGDEFAVFCVDHAQGDLEALKDRVAEVIQNARLARCPDLIPTASVGCVILSSDQDCDAFLARGDLELHEAKQASHHYYDAWVASR